MTGDLEVQECVYCGNPSVEAFCSAKCEQAEARFNEMRRQGGRGRSLIYQRTEGVVEKLDQNEWKRQHGDSLRRILARSVKVPAGSTNTDQLGLVNVRHEVGRAE